jgi:glycosyltransferase involved in cell wall biosynthesis
MRVLVWQWGRFGAGPRFASLLAEGLSELPGISVTLSLSADAEILRGATPPRCDIPVNTYSSQLGFLARAASAPFLVRGLARRIAASRPDMAVCAMPGPLDLWMAAALRRLRIPFVVLVHDADAHPGDGMPLQMVLQRLLCRCAIAVAALSTHVGDRLVARKLAGTPGRPLIRLRHPPMRYAFSPMRERDPETFHLLSFGRLLPYKGLDLLAETLAVLGPRPGLSVRVVGSGPESPALSALREMQGVTVENRWVPETEVGALVSWADAIVLPYREASQSGVAAVALAANRYIVATNVGGLREQLADQKMAVVCEPDARSLADGIESLLHHPPAAVATPESEAEWRDVGQTLIDQTRAFMGAT